MNRPLRWLFATTLVCCCASAHATPAPTHDLLDSSTTDVLYESFENTDEKKGYDLTWASNNGLDSRVALPSSTAGTIRHGLQTTRQNARPRITLTSKVPDKKAWDGSTWSVSLYGIISCCDNAALFGLGDAEKGAYLVAKRGEGNTLAIAYGSTAKKPPTEVRCERTIGDSLDTDLRLYTFTFDGTNVALYVDGVLQGEKEKVTDAANWKADSAFQVGTSTGGNPKNIGLAFAEGLVVDAVAVHDFALSQEEINELTACFPRIEHVNTKVVYPELPASWTDVRNFPTYVRLYDKNVADVSAYHQIRKLNDGSHEEKWSVAAFAKDCGEAGDIVAIGTGTPDKGPALLIVQGGTAKTLAGATFAADYSGDTMVHVQGAVEAERIVGGGIATEAGLTFAGNSYITVDAPGATISSDLVAGCVGEPSTQEGDATLTLKAGTFTGALLPMGEGSTLSGTSALVIEGTIDLSKATVGVFNSLSLAGGLTLGETRLPELTLSAPHATLHPHLLPHGGRKDGRQGRALQGRLRDGALHPHPSAHGSANGVERVRE